MNTEFSSSEIRGSQRRRKDTNSDDHQPLFLKKCYHMISTSPPDISSWSEDGQSFIIYDVNRFSSELIPTVYKHNKFPSFVRQLNFYGFRKVRSELPQQANFWEFKHPLFRRGEMAALSQIKKSAHFDEHSVDNQVSNMSENVNELKSHVWTLNQRVSNLDNIVEDLSQSLRNLGAISSESQIIQNSYQSQSLQPSQTAPSTQNPFQRQDSVKNTSSPYVVSAPVLKRKTSGNNQYLPLSRQTSTQLQVVDFEDEFWDFANTFSTETLQSIAMNDHNNSLTGDATFSDSNDDVMGLYGPTSNISDNNNNNMKYEISTFNGIDSIGLFTSQHADTPSSTPSALPFSPTSYVSNNYNNKNIVTTTTNTIVTQEAIKIQVDVNAEVNAAIRKSEQLVDTVTMSDIPAILKLLPESLQARFVDRLAEAVGSRLRNTTPSTAPSTATVTGTETIKPYWETMSLPSSTPVSNNMSSQSSLPPHTSASADTQSTRPWVPTVFTAPSILDQQYTAFQATRVFGTLVNGMKEPPVSNVTSNVQGSLSEGQIALRALANQFQLAAATVHLQGRMQAAAATNTNAAPSNAPESNEAFPY